MALDGAGKRAAFALFYAPLHFLTLSRIVQSIGGPAQRINSLLDSAAVPARRRSVGAGMRPAAIDDRNRSSSMGSP